MKNKNELRDQEKKRIFDRRNQIEDIRFDEECVICQNEGPHDQNDREHVFHE